MDFGSVKRFAVNDVSFIFPTLVGVKKLPQVTILELRDD